MTTPTLAAFFVLAAAAAAVPPGATRSADLDTSIEKLMEKWRIPGGAVTIAVDGNLVYSRGFGVADVDSGAPVRPDSLFRLASVSKPVTAAAILQLVNAGKIGLDQPVLQILGLTAAAADPRLQRVTIRHLLQHSGGWDAEVSGDPVYPSWELLQELGADFPPSREQMILFVLGEPLDFEPGTQHAYSNFGYVLLGRVIEAVTGERYEDWVRDHLLEPEWKQGGTLPRDLAEGEVCYYDNPGAQPALSIFSAAPLLAPAQYGSFSLALQDSAGGWVAPAPGLVRLLTRLPETTLRAMAGRPTFTASAAPVWYGLGFNVIPTPAGTVFQHAGAFAGTVSDVVLAPGFAYAAVFNSRPDDYVAFLGELQQILLQAYAE
jgi:N-acyl-D-amino-acid deacylase